MLDDVSTTGNSIQACKDKLLQAGTQRVICVVIGKTYSSYESSKLSNESSELSKQQQAILSSACRWQVTEKGTKMQFFTENHKLYKEQGGVLARRRRKVGK